MKRACVHPPQHSSCVIHVFGTCVRLYSTLPCLVQAPSRLTMLRCGPRWLMIFSSDIRAWVSLLRAVAGRHHRSQITIIHNIALIHCACSNQDVSDTSTGFSALHLSIFTATLVEDWELVSPYAVASTTLPKAPDPRVRPKESQTWQSFSVYIRT